MMMTMKSLTYGCDELWYYFTLWE